MTVKGVTIERNSLLKTEPITRVNGLLLKEMDVEYKNGPRDKLTSANG